jgi:hypothetical protein
MKPSWAKHPVEMGGMGYYNPDTNMIYDIFLVECEVSAMSNDFGGAAVLAKVGMRKHMDRIKVQWHVHPGNMGVSPSHTDTDNIDDLGEGMDYLISIIVNGVGDLFCRVDLFQPFRHTEKVEAIVPYIIATDKFLESLQADVEANVKKIETPDIEIINETSIEKYRGSENLSPFGYSDIPLFDMSSKETVYNIPDSSFVNFQDYAKLSPEQQTIGRALFRTTTMSWGAILKRMYFEENMEGRKNGKHAKS